MKVTNNINKANDKNQKNFYEIKNHVIEFFNLSGDFDLKKIIIDKGLAYNYADKYLGKENGDYILLYKAIMKGYFSNEVSPEEKLKIAMKYL